LSGKHSNAHFKGKENWVRIEYSQNNQEFYRLSKKDAQKKKNEQLSHSKVAGT